MNKALFIIPIVIVGGIAAYAVSPYFTESTVDEPLPPGAITRTGDGMMDDTMDDKMMDGTMMDDTMMEGEMSDKMEGEMSDKMEGEMSDKMEGEMMGETMMDDKMEGAMADDTMMEGEMMDDTMMEGAMADDTMADIAVDDKMMGDGMMDDTMAEGETMEEPMDGTGEMMEGSESTEGSMSDTQGTAEDAGEMIETMPSEDIPATPVTYSGTFVGVGDGVHDASGDAYTYYLEDGSSGLRLENFFATNGPGLRVYLSTDKGASDYVSLGDLKANMGNQNYDIPDGTDLEKYNKVLIWCEPFRVLFGSADITPDN